MNLEQLLKEPGIWRGRGRASLRPGALSTGWPVLDEQLPCGGWPESALTEILVTAPGSGELTLVLPALKRLTRSARRVMCVAPPHLPYAPAWAQQGVSLSRLQLVEALPADALWCTEQALRSGTCGAVLCWPERIDDRRMRRLQLAAEEGDCHGFVFRPVSAAETASPAALRLTIAPPGRVKVLKCRGTLTKGSRCVVIPTQAGFDVQARSPAAITGHREP